MKKQYYLIVLICLCIAGVTSTTFADSNSQAAAILLDRTTLADSNGPAAAILLDRIALGEGTSDAAAQKHGLASNYDITYSYGKYNPTDSKPLSEMTIGEVKQLQQQMIANEIKAGIDPKDASGAVGKYQLIAKTLKLQQKILGLSNDTKFDAATQELFGLSLLEKRGFSKWSDGTITDHDFQKDLAREWASVADPDTGKSYYRNNGKSAQPGDIEGSKPTDLQHVGTTDAQIKEAMTQAMRAALEGSYLDMQKSSWLLEQRAIDANRGLEAF